MNCAWSWCQQWITQHFLLFFLPVFFIYIFLLCLYHGSSLCSSNLTFLPPLPLQLWSEMESSDDDTLSERSCASEPSFRSECSGGSLSPCPSGLVGLPGDTLPWNLSKHERRKRKSQNSVLDPAERAVVRVAGKEIRLCFRLFSVYPWARSLNIHLLKCWIGRL